jgi:hypothetical protein
MGLMAFLNLEGRDIVGFVLANLLGLLVGTLVPQGSWAIYTSILVSYHLFLIWLIVLDDQTGVSLPIVSTIVTHVACLVVVLPLGMGRHYIPFFGIFRYSIAALAIFERKWLFSEESSQRRQQIAPAAAPVIVDTAEDYRDWLQHLAQQKPGTRNPRSSLKAEYEQWLLARAKSRLTVPANNQDSGAR